MSKHSYKRVSRRDVARLESSPFAVSRPTAAGLLLGVLAALVAANLFVYAGVWRFDFVNFDDPQYILENSHIAGGLTLDSVLWALRTDYASNWHPLTWWSYMLDAQIYGATAGALHVTNLLLHIANSLLLFWVLYRMTTAVGRSAFVAILFAVHPLHVESVAWVTERKDVLSTLFWLLTIVAYVFYVQQPRTPRYILVLVLFALGLMAKPMLVTLPFALLLLDFWPLRRLGTQPTRETALRLVVEKIPLLALAVVSSVVTFLVQQRTGAVRSLDMHSFSERVQNASLAYVEYVGKTFWPDRLAMFYPYRAQMPVWWPLAALGLIVSSVLAVRLARRFPYVPVGWFWFVGTLVPVIGLVQVGLQSMADRYMYIPSIGLFIVVGWGAVDVLAAMPYRNVVLAFAFGLTLLLCAKAARAQVGHWENSQALWEHALSVTSDNYMAHNGLGGFLTESGKPADALPHFTESIRLNPTEASTHQNLGIALAAMGRFDEAVAAYSESLRLNAERAEVHSSLGAALAAQGKKQEAIEHYSKALQIMPDLADANQNMGVGLAELGRVDEAVKYLSEAVRLKPASPRAHDALATSLLTQGKFDEAISEYFKAVKLKPDFADAHNNLAVALLRKNRAAEAVDHFHEALQFKPDNADAHYNLGYLLSTQGKIQEAIHEFSEVLRIDPSHADARQMMDKLRK